MNNVPKKLPIACMLLSSLFLSSCGTGSGTRSHGSDVLRIASWDEYIDEGGEDSYVEGSRPLYEEFEDWYYEQTGKTIRVEYVPLQDNETMYNKIKMGDKYDLLCPSEYMIMKLAAEGKLQKLPESFFDVSIAENYYAQYESGYINEVFRDITTDDGTPLSEYVAGYMWGTTGFVFNQENVPEEDVASWSVFTDKKYNKNITAKDNVRDSYFVGLGLYYEEELNALKDELAAGSLSLTEYKEILSELMNDTSVDTMIPVKKELEKMRSNLYGLETDEGKQDVILGRLDISYQWSGDAVYIMDEAEENGFEYGYSVPESASNLWFDGWVMMDGANTEAATMFINFVSKPENVVRNMYYIGYTSCFAGDEVFAYVEETYGAEENETDVSEYDLSYFFGENHILTAYTDQLTRQLFAQYPDEETLRHCVVMQYFDKDANLRANRMWNNIK